MRLNDALWMGSHMKLCRFLHIQAKIESLYIKKLISLGFAIGNHAWLMDFRKYLVNI